jgi:hypothetical protein
LVLDAEEAPEKLGVIGLRHKNISSEAYRFSASERYKNVIDLWQPVLLMDEPKNLLLLLLSLNYLFILVTNGVKFFLSLLVLLLIDEKVGTCTLAHLVFEIIHFFLDLFKLENLLILRQRAKT